ncbi:MAG TPA: VIT1/CCC1 transporter family protein [bacterium]
MSPDGALPAPPAPRGEASPGEHHALPGAPAPPSGRSVAARRRGAPDMRARARLREMVFGVQDGLVSTLGALTGIAEGTRDAAAVIIAGCVIIVVESLSMAAGSYLSSKAQREYLARLLREEEEAIERDPAGERRELVAMYRARGWTEEEIAVIARRLLSDKRLLLEDMAHKELGIYPEALERPASNAFTMGTAYVIGGCVPAAPYLIWTVREAMLVSVLATAAALFLFGAFKGRMVKTRWWMSGLEMLGIAGLAAVAGYGIGHLAGRWVR